MACLRDTLHDSRFTGGRNHAGGLLNILLTSSAQPPIVIVKAYDIVFAEIGTILHFDDMQNFGAEIFKTMRGFDRDGCTFAHSKVEQLFSPGHPGRPCNHHPMFASFVMELER